MMPSQDIIYEQNESYESSMRGPSILRATNSASDFEVSFDDNLKNTKQSNTIAGQEEATTSAACHEEYI